MLRLFVGMSDNNRSTGSVNSYAASHRQTMLRHSGVPPVLVVLDLAEDPTRPLGVAWSRASGIGASLVVCHVSPEGEGRDQGPLVREAVDRWIAMVCPNNDHVEIDLRRGKPAAEILACAEEHDACLIVVGEVAHREGWFARLFRPNVTTEVVRAASRPVLVARHNYGTGRIIVATDLSEPSLPTLRAAVEELDRAGGLVTVLHCIPPTMTMAGDPSGSMLAAASFDAVMDSAAVRLMAAVRSVGLLDAVCRVVIDDPASAITTLARQLTADLVIVGTHGRSGADRVIMGSVAEAVVRDAPCHVLVVRLHEVEHDRTDVIAAVAHASPHAPIASGTQPAAQSYDEIVRESVPLPTLIYRSTDSEINAAVRPPPDDTAWASEGSLGSESERHRVH